MVFAINLLPYDLMVSILHSDAQVLHGELKFFIQACDLDELYWEIHPDLFMIQFVNDITVYLKGADHHVSDTEWAF